MTSRLANICADAHDPLGQARWWSQVLDDFTVDPRAAVDDEEVELLGPLGRGLIFLRVPESKTVKNRVHWCIRPVEHSRDEEVQRLLGLGATIVDDLRSPESGWAVLADPEGNEFCVLTRRAEEAGVRLDPDDHEAQHPTD